MGIVLPSVSICVHACGLKTGNPLEEENSLLDLVIWAWAAYEILHPLADVEAAESLRTTSFQPARTLDVCTRRSPRSYRTSSVSMSYLNGNKGLDLSPVHFCAQIL